MRQRSLRAPGRRNDILDIKRGRTLRPQLDLCAGVASFHTFRAYMDFRWEIEDRGTDTDAKRQSKFQTGFMNLYAIAGLNRALPGCGWAWRSRARATLDICVVSCAILATLTSKCGPKDQVHWA